ncbi:MAG: DUF5107 domain-containing protein [bacterium]|nr:DUF5107 domain-containing protein [bacterium]
MKKHLFNSAIILIILFLINTVLYSQDCVIKEETWKIKTYTFSDPDPIPILVKNPRIYPYFSFNKHSDKGKDRVWKVVLMENEYVKVYILPEVGGKIFGAVEKSTGNEFLYHNKVLKFRQISMRGPWTSGGIEFNFGIVGHTPAVATPVDYLIRNNEDGSVSCFIGTMDITSRTRWSVEINLPADKAYFKTRTLWYNNSPLHQSYYSWSNNAVKVGDDLQYYYPGVKSVPHSYTVPAESWPVDSKGRDVSLYRNNTFGGNKSRFIMGEYEHFFGGYWHDSDFGFGHWALYDEMPGKKMWIWALSRAGGIWEDLLTDKDGQYTEPQSGRLFSQTDHAFFPPYTGDTWEEILFPFKGIGGLSKATPSGAVNINRAGNTLTIGFCPFESINEMISVQQNGTEIYSEMLDLDPMDVWQKEITIPAFGGEIEVFVRDKLYYTTDESKNDVKRPIEFHNIDESTNEGLYLAGEFHETRRDYDRALEKYTACLDNDPQHIRAMTRIAELFYRRCEYEKGLELASRALEIDMYNTGANYIYGIISRKLGNYTDAKETLGWAARSMEFRSNAFCQISGIYLLEKDYQTADIYAQKSLDFNKFNLKAYETLAIINRKLNNNTAADAALNSLLDIEPLNHFARFEKYLLTPSENNMNSFKNLIRTEITHETFLELGISYMNLGLTEEAVTLLKNSPEHPMTALWLAYLQRNSSPDESGSYLAEALEASPEFVFPFREETIPVLQWASDEKPDEWKPKYYRGLIYWFKGRNVEAAGLFKDCGNHNFAPLYTSLSYLDRNNAERYLRLAMESDTENWRYRHNLIRHYGSIEDHNKALETAREAIRKFKDETAISVDYAGALFNNGFFRECLDKLNDLTVLPYEGGWEAHNLFMRTQIYLAMEQMKDEDYRKAIDYLEKSKEFPERLGTGEPYEPDNRLQEYLQSMCYDRMNRSGDGDKIRLDIYNYTDRNRTEPGQSYYFALLTLRDLGKSGESDRLVKDLEAKFPNDATVQWHIARFRGDLQKVREIENRLGNNPRFKYIADTADFLDEFKK